MRSVSVVRVGLLLLVLAALSACTVPPTLEGIEKAQQEGRLDEAVKAAEKARDAKPNQAEARLSAAWAYYFKAREALDARKDAEYAAFLDKSMSEAVEAARLRPNWDQPHFVMGVVLAYQTKIDEAVTSFENTLRLGPYNLRNYTNLAETLVYQGNVERARRLLDRAKRNGAPPELRDKTMMLAAWKQGDFDEAKDIFASAIAVNPIFVNDLTDMATSPKPIQTFDDYVDYCCGNPVCGPLMRRACIAAEREVAERDLEREAVLKEMRIEMERRRKLREIYEEHKDLKIEVEAPEDPASAGSR